MRFAEILRGRLAGDRAAPGARSGVFPQGVRSEAERGQDMTGALFCKAPDGSVEYVPGKLSPVLAFDIETTGLSESDTVTCVCAYDAERDIDFRMCPPGGQVCEEFLALLDEAPLLCAFNGVLFDMPFMAKRWRIPPARVAGWAVKLLDPYQACKLALGVTFSLDKLLGANGMACKTGNGKEAVVMAREGRWLELEDYCMSDTTKTHAVVAAGRAVIPGDAWDRHREKKSPFCLVANPPGQKRTQTSGDGRGRGNCSRN